MKKLFVLLVMIVAVSCSKIRDAVEHKETSVEQGRKSPVPTMIQIEYEEVGAGITMTPIQQVQ